jgi:hypothetical protein
MKILSSIKNTLVPAGTTPRTIRAGLLKGITLNLDLRSQTQVYWGTAELELAKYFRELSKGIHTALDVGAAEGIYSLFWLKKTDVEKVIAFEPGEAERQRMTRNLELNGLAESNRIQLIPKFVGAENNQELCTLDSIKPRITMPCLVKLDIEGAEAEVLRHAGELLVQQTRWIIEVHAFHLERECLELLKKASYTTRIISPAWWRAILPENRSLEHNRWVIAIRD